METLVRQCVSDCRCSRFKVMESLVTESSVITQTDSDANDLCFLSDAEMGQLLWGVTMEQVAPSGKW